MIGRQKRLGFRERDVIVGWGRGMSDQMESFMTKKIRIVEFWACGDYCFLEYHGGWLNNRVNKGLGYTAKQIKNC